MFTAGKEDTRAYAQHDSQQPEPSNGHLRSLRLCDPRTEIVTGARTRQTCTVPNHSVHWTTRPRARFGPATTACFRVCSGGLQACSTADLKVCTMYSTNRRPL